MTTKQSAVPRFKKGAKVMMCGKFVVCDVGHRKTLEIRTDVIYHITEHKKSRYYLSGSRHWNEENPKSPIFFYEEDFVTKEEALKKFQQWMEENG